MEHAEPMKNMGNNTDINVSQDINNGDINDRDINSDAQSQAREEEDVFYDQDSMGEDQFSAEQDGDGRIEALEAKIKELENQNLRVYADFENAKKRLERDKFQALEYANEAILKDLLPIFDSLEKALEAIKPMENSDAIGEGIKLVMDNLIKALGKHGAEIIDCEGQFDPNLHEAIAQTPNPDKNDGDVDQVFQRGFKYKERVLRPAMVSVAKN